MKKNLRHVNRGIVVSVILIFGVIIYLAAVAVIQGREKPVIEAICREYVAAEIQYSQFPEVHRSPESTISEEQFETYLQEMEAKLIPFYIDNDRIREIAYERMVNYLENQLMSQSPVQSFEKTIQSFNSFVFDGSRVTVEFTSQSAIEFLENEYYREPGGRVTGETTDLIVLEKDSGQWRVVYASLSEPYRSYRY